MHQAATRFTAISVSVFLLSFAPAASANPASPNKEKTITIAEGTDVFVTLSPDHKTIIAKMIHVPETLTLPVIRLARAPDHCKKSARAIIVSAIATTTARIFGRSASSM